MCRQLLSDYWPLITGHNSRPLRSISSAITTTVHWPCCKPISLWCPYQVSPRSKYTDLVPNTSAFEVYMKCRHTQSTLTFFHTHQPLRSTWNATMPKVHQPCSKPVSLWGPYQVPSCPKYTDLLPNTPALEVHIKCHHAQSTQILFSTHQDLLQHWSPMWMSHIKIPFLGTIMCMESKRTN